MSSSPVQPIPAGMHTVTPHLVCGGAADAIAFYREAFGAVELSRLPGPGGRLMHASIRIGDCVVMLTDEAPEWGSLGAKALGGTPVVLHLYVADADAAFARALAAGATARMPVADMFWGDRYGQVDDPFGHRWAIATHVRDLSAEQIQEAMREMATPSGAPKEGR